MHVLFLIAGLLLQAPPEYLIRHFTVDDGLPVDAINGIVQDADGYLYVSTYNGLVRYDGYDFELFNSGNTPDMRTNRIAGLLLATDGTLWLFNEGGTLTSKKGATFRTYPASELPGLATWLAEDPQGRLWVGGTQGLALFDPETARFERMGSPVPAPVNVVEPHPAGGLLLVNSEGLYLLEGQRSTLLLADAATGFVLGSVLDIHVMDESRLWLIGSDQALLFDMRNRRVEQVVDRSADQLTLASTSTTGPAGYLFPDRKGDTGFRIELIGRNGERIRVGSDRVAIDGHIVYRGPPIKRVMIDQEGSLWIGTLSEGLYQIRRSSFANIGAASVPGLTNVYSIIQDRNAAIWACSFTNGIFRLAGSEHRRWDPGNSGLVNTYCKVLFEDSDGTIYAGLNNEGLWMFRNGDWVRLSGYDRLVQGTRRSVEALHRQGNRLFVSSFSSLVVLEDGRFRYFDAAQPQELAGIQVFAETTRGAVFAGTEGNGLVRLEGDRYRTYTAESGLLNSNTIRDLYLQADDTLWVVHESMGLNRLVLDRNGEIVASASVTLADGLLQNSLHRMLDDGRGHFWISGNSGIMRISRAELNAYADGRLAELRVLGFNEKDGMIDREANGGVQSAGLRTADGSLWFPNQSGITLIRPDAFSADYGLDVPAPVFETIELDGRNLYVRHADAIGIPGHQRDFRVRFAVPNFVNQDRLRFTYLLEGVNERWQDATDFRQAVFTGVPPGRHVLRIRSQFIGGEPVESALVILVPPRFHETAWFGLLVVCAAIGFLYVGYKYRIRTLEATERTLQDRVREQTRALQQAAEDKQRFFTGITHELKTPLSLIMGPLGDLMDDPAKTADAPLYHRLNLMQRNSQRLKNLVDQILDVSKLNAHAITLTLQPVDLARLTRQILGQFQSSLEQQRITLDLPDSGFTEPIYVDREAWERVLINLMSNAITFSPPGSTIHVGFRESEREVEVRLRDQGPGIAPEHQARIFDYLYQVEGAKASEGTGIGLYLVKGLMEEMGGAIRVRSEPGAGAEFIVSLKKGHSHIAERHTLLHDPLVQDEPPATDRPAAPAALPRTGAAATGRRILVVEDNPDFRSYLQSILQDRYEVLTAANGRQGLDLLEHETPDLIVSDVMMPEMDGLEFVHLVRAQPAFEQVPVIFLSAKNEEADVRKGLSTGADVYLTKPIRGSMLLAQIEAVLRRERIILQQEADEPEFLRRVRELVYRQLGNPSLNVNQLADALYMSRGKLYLEWKKVSDIGLNDYVKQTRLQEARVLLEERGFSVQEAARAVGYADANYFSTSYKKRFGHPPTRKR